MTVTLIAKTESILNPLGLPGNAKDSKYQDEIQYRMRGSLDGGHDDGMNLEVAEFAGRLCYESFHLPNPGTVKQDDYLRNIVKQGHYSVLEHVSVSFYVEGVSRNLSHELIRHRHLSFSEVSQRYVDMGEANKVTPPALGGGVKPLDEIEFDRYSTLADLLQETGVKGKKAREAARSVLPGGMETKFVVTGNLRAWRDVLLKRWSSHADAEMQLFAEEVKNILDEHYKVIFEDIKYE